MRGVSTGAPPPDAACGGAGGGVVSLLRPNMAHVWRVGRRSLAATAALELTRAMWRKTKPPRLRRASSGRAGEDQGGVSFRRSRTSSRAPTSTRFCFATLGARSMARTPTKDADSPRIERPSDLGRVAAWRDEKDASTRHTAAAEQVATCGLLSETSSVPAPALPIKALHRAELDLVAESERRVRGVERLGVSTGRSPARHAPLEARRALQR